MSEEITKNANSSGLILDYYNIDNNNIRDGGVYGRRATFDTDKALKIIKNDPVVKGAIITLVDKVIESDWRIEGKNQKSNKQKLHDFLKEQRFDSLIKRIVYNLLLYNNAFIEVVKKKNTVTDLNLLETNLMQIDADDNGDINFYFQEPGKDKHIWMPDEIVHIKIDEFTTNVWAELNIEAIYETILIKDYARQWLNWFFSTNQVRPILNIQGANEAKVKDFLSYLRSTEKNLKKPLIVDGELTVGKLQSFADEGASVFQLISWCDAQIGILLQTPAISLGLSEGSGRSDGVELKEGLNVRVNSIHKTLEESFSYDLFKKIGYSRNLFKFGTIDDKVAQRVFENILLMRQAQFTEEAIAEYMEKQGITFDTEKVLKDPMELAQMSNKELGTGNEGLKGNKDANSAQSRNTQNAQDLKKANSNEMVKNTFNGYPYVYEVEQ